MRKLSILFLLLGSFTSFAQEAKLLWSDEFDQNGLPNPQYWGYDVGDHGWGNQELEYYTEANLQNARIEEGVLKITAIADSSYSKGYTSARIHTRGKKSWKYGYIEVKAKLPSGRGTWPAIWMLPEENLHGGWPANGEIDIMEHVGFDPGVVHGTVHTKAFNHKIGTQKGNSITVPKFDSEFHVYAIDWTTEKIDFFIDDELYFTFENNGGNYEEWPFDQEFHLILNIAVGGGWGGQKGVDPTIWPQQIEVDYVRVYDRKPSL
ncbi:glycoside hydrolase family 16 protein [Algoriphagus machipongonensis]|uniref:Licheninase n=1 Tax=Algoriphagus machipongonensis TaxID=388413 RepID=A3HX16_9BACT|nr:glycoside hydrolase family 16 protein [Algoriphagus machipongonensis]EAZ81139.1 licheninase [Algoriphagus machipongonensis]